MTRTATGSLDCCAPSPTVGATRPKFDERMDAALAARTIDALAPLTADLIAARSPSRTLEG